jgi:PAS domain S-box-containing protein
VGDGKDKLRSKNSAELRRSAEKQLRGDTTAVSPAETETETRRLFHELQVHQIELEMQNAELQRIQDELELSRNKYTEFYDFAPVGYFCLDPSGLILEINLHGAQLLGEERQRLVNRPFSDFIADSGQQKIFARHLAMVLQQQITLRCEISLTSKDGTVVQTQFQSVSVKVGNQAGKILSSAIDITSRRRLENDLQKAHDKLESLVNERTAELTKANALLVQEVDNHRRAEEKLKNSYAEVRTLKDQLLAENIYLQEEVGKEYNFHEIIGQSNALSYVFFRVEQAAPQDVTVLLLGETGTGKGMFARAIHSRSVRKNRPLITVNCTALPANLIESELFGREKGAFTGAHTRQMGRFELANGGTIFLDEIGEMPMELQSKLLRVIQDGEFERLGSPHTIKVDVRIIAASNRNLEDEISSGRFRQDLFYRLNVFPITIPPLRSRKEDIPLLVNHFVAKFNKKIGRRISTVPQQTLKSLQEYHWPGNVRELENVIERAVITSQGPSLQVRDRFDSLPHTDQDNKSLADVERNHILKVLQDTGWRIEGPKGAAVRLDLNPSTLRARMRKYGLRRH